MSVKLLPHQIDALDRMKNGCILNGDVGSGKSITALAYYYIRQGGPKSSMIDQDYVMMKNPKDLYIITTARKRDDLEWDKELGPFLLSRHPEATPYKNKVVVDSWNNIKKYRKVYNAFFIFDEQKVVGKGVWVKTFLDIARKNEWILLSATPGDKWEDYIPVFIANGFYRNRTEFMDRHVVFDRRAKYPRISQYLNTGILIRHRRSILVNMSFTRKTRSHHEDVFVDYDLATYRSVRKDRWDPYRNEPITSPSILTYILRRVVNSDESRQVAVLELFEKHPKMIIFYNYNYELEILRAIFTPLQNVEVAEWNGQTHQPVPDSKSWVYLVQYTAGCEGWNCIKTDTMIFFSQSGSYRIMHQASGRIDRLNTPYLDLYYYHLKSRSSVDLSLARAYEERKDFNASAFGRFEGGYS